MLITTQKDLDIFCETVENAPFITVDTEFLREKTYFPLLCLIQASGPDGKGVAIDPLVGDLDLTPFFNLMFDPKILKIFHAARQDLEIFFKLTRRVVQPFFDTQIAAMVCGYGDSIGYESLVRNLTGNSLDKSVQYTDWSRRPLSERQIEYAIGDVTFLVEIYQKLSKELEKRGRTSWVFEEEEYLSAPSTYQNPPTDAWERIKVRSPKPKTLAVLREIAAWREEKAQERDKPRGWIMRDETLADMAAQAPTDVAQLKRIRGVSEDLASGNTGKGLIDLIKKTLGSDPKTWPQPGEKDFLPPQAAATVDILKMLLKIQCAENEVAQKLVADQDDLEKLATEAHPDIPALKGWRHEVFGRHALMLKAGTLALGMKKNRITRFKIHDGAEEYKEEA
ncbi:MAG: ribonuclease D [Alphaproteobacteria bacterium]